MVSCRTSLLRNLVPTVQIHLMRYAPGGVYGYVCILHVCCIHAALGAPGGLYFFSLAGNIKNFLTRDLPTQPQHNTTYTEIPRVASSSLHRHSLPRKLVFYSVSRFMGGGLRVLVLSRVAPCQWLPTKFFFTVKLQVTVTVCGYV